jgi:hypothetical protein
MEVPQAGVCLLVRVPHPPYAPSMPTKSYEA